MTDEPLPASDAIAWLKSRVAYLEGEVARLREVEREIERLRREASKPKD